LAFRFVWEPWWDLNDGSTHHLPEGERNIAREEARERGRAAPLARELAGRDMNDLDWNQANATRFIACVGVTDFLNCGEQPQDARQQSELPQATCTITVTRPEWLAHMAPGMDWETTAFDDDVWPRIDPSWQTTDVKAIALGIDRDQAFDRMPILADALQDAECNNDDLLNHLRDTAATHVPGCWALDLVLGKDWSDDGS
jgi:hypothetical protein